MIMKVISIIFLIFVILKCDYPNDSETEYNIVEKYSLCIIDSNGENHRVLKEDGYSGAFFHFMSDDKIFIMWSNNIYHFDIKTEEATFIANLPQTEIRDRVISPDGQFLAFVNFQKDNSDLYLVDLYGKNLTNLTNSPHTLKRWPAFSSNGSKIIFNTSSDYDDQTISYYDFITDTVQVALSHFDTHTKINPILYYWYPCFGKADNQIFYIKRNTDSTSVGDTLYYYNMLTKTYNILDANARFTEKLIISDSKNRLTYFKIGNPCAVAVVDPDGNNKRILDNEVSYYCEYNISGDGEKIIYWDSYYDDDSSDSPLFIINKDGSDKIKLGSGSNAYFSDDDKTIVFSGYVRTK